MNNENNEKGEIKEVKSQKEALPIEGELTLESLKAVAGGTYLFPFNKSRFRFLNGN